LKAGVWFRRARFFIIAPDSQAQNACRQAEIPLNALFKIPGPPQVCDRFTIRKDVLDDGAACSLGVVQRERVDGRACKNSLVVDVVAVGRGGAAGKESN